MSAALLANRAAIRGEDDLLALAAHVAVVDGRIVITLEVAPPPDDPSLTSPLQYLAPTDERVIAWREQWLQDRDNLRLASKTSTRLSARIDRLCLERSGLATGEQREAFRATLELRLSR